MDIDNKKTSNKNNKKRDMSISAVFTLGILIVVNFFSYNIFYRWDLTDTKIYSVSSVTKEALHELDDVVNIKAYFSSNLPSQLFSLKQEVGDILDEYAAYSAGKIHVEFVDPLGDDKLKQELYMKGIPELTFEVLEKDKKALVRGYMGIAVSFGDKTEVIPALKRDISDLEYQLTSKIKKVSRTSETTIGFLTSQDSVSLEQSFQSAKALIEEIYSIQPVALEGEDSSIPSFVDTLIIPGPKGSFDEAAQKAINAFLFRGGKLLVLLDGVNIGEGMVATPNATGLDELLDKYGFKINKNLLGDKKSAIASFSQGFFSFSTPYEYWPQFTSESFSEKYSAVASLENVIMPWASSLDYDAEKINSEGVVELFKTSENSWAINDNFNIIPGKIKAPSSGLKSHIVGLAYNGTVQNPYKEEGKEDFFEARLIVVGDSDFATDSFVRNNPDNLNLFLNLIDSLSLDDDLIKIRSKSVSSRPIDVSDLDSAKKGIIRYLNVFGLTIVIVVFGIIRYFLRRRSSFVDEL